MALKADIYSSDAKKKGDISLPEEIFNAEWNPNLVHDVVTAMDANARTPLAHTKGRGEVSGGGKKPWKQKGTGRARHGSTRSPIWTGGGIALGPVKERSYKQKINKKAKHAALKSALSEKLRKNNVLFVDGVSFAEPKTKSTKELLKSLSGIEGFDVLGSRRANLALFVTDSKNEIFDKSIRNIGNLDTVPASNLDVRDLLLYRNVVFLSPEKTIEALSNRLAK